MHRYYIAAVYFLLGQLQYKGDVAGVMLLLCVISLVF